MTTAPGMKNSVDISVLYHLQTPLDAIRGSKAIALSRTPKPDPAETRRIFHEIGRQTDLFNRLAENMIYQAETEADPTPWAGGASSASGINGSKTGWCSPPALTGSRRAGCG